MVCSLHIVVHVCGLGLPLYPAAESINNLHQFYEGTCFFNHGKKHHLRGVKDVDEFHCFLNKNQKLQPFLLVYLIFGETPIHFGFVNKKCCVSFLP